MNEFTEMIREAFLGEEAYDPTPGREALEESIRRFESRDRVVRLLSWFMVTAMSVVMFWAAWRFWKTDAQSSKALVGYATLVLAASGGVGFGKMFLFNVQSDLKVMKEIKRTQLMLLER